MATFLSGVRAYTWSGYAVEGTLTGDVSRSGNTVTLSNMMLSLTCPAGSAWGTDTLSFTVEGSSTSFPVTASGTSLGSHSLNNASKNVAASDTTASFSWSSSDGFSGSFDVSFSPGGDAPSGAFISAKQAGTDSITLIGGVTNGGSSAASVELVVLERAYTQSGIPQRYEPLGGALSGTKTITNSSPTSSGGITISPNKLYYVGVYANNSAGDLRYDGGTVVTLPMPITLGEPTVADDEVTIPFQTEADGGFYEKIIEYSIDGELTWVTAATITGGSASTGSFTITDLPSGTTTVAVRARTTSGASASSSITVEVRGVNSIVSAEGVSKKATRALASVDGIAREITRVLVSKSGVATES